MSEARPEHDSRCILYGTAWKRERTASLVERALVLGFRGVDTACQPKHYDEAGVGRGVAAALARGIPRGELYLQTKFTPLGGQDPRRVPYDRRARVAVQIAESCRTSLQNLGVEHVDALLLHSPISPFEALREAWQALEALVDAGQVHALGISNCYDLHLLSSLHQSARIKPSVVQNRFYRETGYDVDVRTFCRQHRIRYQSFWTLTANPHLLAHREILTLAASYAVTPAQILFRYLTQVGVTPLSGTTSELHMQQAVAIFELSLAPAELDAVTRLLKLPRDEVAI
jgi:diketogulonate reductase-like aldo/keto reductase